MKPLPLILGAVALLLLTRRANAAGTAGALVVPVRNTTPTAANPPAVAATFAAEVLRGITGGLVSGKTSATTTAAANAQTEDARAAVRAGDPYYGEGAWKWYAGNVEAAREAVRQGDPYYVSSWSEPQTTAANVWASPATMLDGIVAAPAYDPAADADLAAGLIPAGLLGGW